MNPRLSNSEPFQFILRATISQICYLNVPITLLVLFMIPLHSAAQTWTQRFPTNSPSARCCYAMAYDQTHANAVLFGGIEAGGRVLGDTWIWDGTNWTQRFPATSPPARGYSSMAYDVQQGRALIFGGASLANNAPASILGDTWAWDGNNWNRLFPSSSPSARFSTPKVA